MARQASRGIVTLIVAGIATTTCPPARSRASLQKGNGESTTIANEKLDTNKASRGHTKTVHDGEKGNNRILMTPRT